jgi:hypothetical protein
MVLKAFTGLGIPEYAILSHTWTDNDEVSYHEFNRFADDLGTLAAQRPAGCSKIMETCREAKGHGFQYAWVDTCCIDKTSSAELTEALNSMFKWYKDAAVCYVYLEDLSLDRHWRESLKNCRWFTRGWCLQELVAPDADKLRFYDRDWKFVGTKRELKDDIACITGIDERVIAGTRSLLTVPVAQKMSWAAERKTSRVEDIAYCLLGIFEVNMPMLYGEGERSFTRLQEEIIQRSNDRSIFYSSPAIDGSDMGDSRPDEQEKRTMDGQQPHLSGLPYRDLFARSPRDFANCGTVEFLGNELFSRCSFERTNNRLHFKETTILVLATQQCYAILLDCAHATTSTSAIEGKGPELGMLLRKIGPGIFARLQSPSVHPTGELYSKELDELYVSCEEEAYIVLDTPRELTGQMYMPRRHAIMFVSHHSEALRHALQEPVPQSHWDAPTMMFLTLSQGAFEGYLKLFPDMIGENLGTASSSQEFVYVACGLEIDFPRRIWVRLFSQKTWNKHQKRLGTMVGLKHLDMSRRLSHKHFTDFTHDELELDDGVIQATVDKDHEPGDGREDFRIRLEIVCSSR